jgi:hypothetical protein
MDNQSNQSNQSAAITTASSHWSQKPWPPVGTNASFPQSIVFDKDTARAFHERTNVGIYFGDHPTAGGGTAKHIGFVTNNPRLARSEAYTQVFGEAAQALPHQSEADIVSHANTGLQIAAHRSGTGPAHVWKMNEPQAESLLADRMSIITSRPSPDNHVSRTGVSRASDPFASTIGKGPSQISKTGGASGP